ncbi:hypothetical protein TNCV_1278511 [Trichonephila clavipes]|nr:hypothetical protein TNCV_1278511 [Trichonephila clavipes]
MSMFLYREDESTVTKWRNSPKGQDLMRPSQYTSPLGAEVHDQMSGSDGQSVAKPSVFKSPSKLDTHLSTHYSRDKRLSRPYPPRE